jgi:hypothetical protein
MKEDKRPAALPGITCRFVPTAPQKTDWIEVCTLRPTDPGVAGKSDGAGFPLNVGFLRERESEDKIKCDILDLEFATPKGTSVFNLFDNRQTHASV